MQQLARTRIHRVPTWFQWLTFGLSVYGAGFTTYQFLQRRPRLRVRAHLAEVLPNGIVRKTADPTNRLGGIVVAIEVTYVGESRASLDRFGVTWPRRTWGRSKQSEWTVFPESPYANQGRPPIALEPHHTHIAQFTEFATFIPAQRIYVVDGRRRTFRAPRRDVTDLCAGLDKLLKPGPVE
jgi:hypothetical protein